MVAEYTVQDFLIWGHNSVLDTFGIRREWTVVDYGCDPGRYLGKAPAFVGPKGRVDAAEVSEVAMRCVERRIRRLGLENVLAVPILNGKARIPDGCAELVYALDMIHAVSDPSSFLREIHRIVKPAGRLILEDGNQPRSRTLEKIAASGAWKVMRPSRLAVTCALLSARAAGAWHCRGD